MLDIHHNGNNVTVTLRTPVEPGRERVERVLITFRGENDPRVATQVYEEVTA